MAYVLDLFECIVTTLRLIDGEDGKSIIGDMLAHVRDLRSIDASTKKGNTNINQHNAKEHKDAKKSCGENNNKARYHTMMYKRNISGAAHSLSLSLSLSL